MTISKALPSSGAPDIYYVVIPGRVNVGTSDISDPYEETTVNPKLALSTEQIEFLSGTVLHSLVEPDTTMYLEVYRNGDTLKFPIPSLRLGELEPRAFYDRDTKQLLGTRLRLPGLAVYANAVYYHQSQGRQAELENLYLSYAADMTRAIDTDVLRTRLAPGISALAMGGDTFLREGEVGITRSLASDLLNQVQQALSDEERKQLAMARSRGGEYILSGYSMVVLRNPTTVYGACRTFQVVVVDSPGAAIYMRSPDIDKAGGDFDGDMLFAFDPIDLSGKRIFEHCVQNKGSKTIKIEDFTCATAKASKKGVVRKVNLDNLSWIPEKEVSIMTEFREKALIGKAWYALVHYDFLTSHYHCEDKKATLDNRLRIIKDRVEIYSEGLLADAYHEFVNKHPEPDWGDTETYKDWVVLSYRAVSEAMFPIYELIFDLRKGDGTPPYRPNEAISALMGYSPSVDWAGMQEGGVWIEILREVHESLPRVYDTRGNVQVDIRQALSGFPAFFYLVNRRRDLSAAKKFASVQALGPYMENSKSFARRLSNGLLYGSPL